MSDDRVLRAYLRFQFDNKDVLKGTDEAVKSIAELRKEAEKLQKEIELKKSVGEGFDDLSKKLKETETRIKAVAQTSRDDLNKTFTESLTKIRQLHEATERLNQVGTIAAFAGGGIAGPFLAAANAFREANKNTDESAKDWEASMRKINASYLQIGGVAAKQIAPVMRLVADVTAGVASLVERYPMIATGALVSGSALLGLGALAAGLAQGIRVVADVKDIALRTAQYLALKENTAALTANTVGKGAGGDMLGSLKSLLPALGLTASVIGGVALGGAAYDYGARNYSLGGGTNVGQFASTGAYAAGSLFGGETGDKWFAAVSELTSAIDKNTQAQLNKDAKDKYKDTDADRDKYMTPAIQEAYKAHYGLGQVLLDQRKAVLEATDAEQHRIEVLEKNRAAEGDDPEDRRVKALADMGERFSKEYVVNQQKAFDVFVQFNKTQTAAQKTYDDQRIAIQKNMYSALSDADMAYANTRAQFTVDFYHQDAARLKAFQDNQAQAEKDFARNESKTLDAYTARRAQETKDFAESEAATEADYYAQRAKAAQDFGEEMAQAEADHQKEMTRFAEDANNTLLDLAGQRDALGLVRAKRQYEKERQRKEQDYTDGIAQRNKEYAKRLVEEDAQFSKERDKRLDDYQKRLAEEQKQFDDEATQRRADYNERTANAQKQFDDETAQRQRDYQLRLAEMDLQHAKENEKRKEASKQALDDLDSRFTAEKTAREADYAERIKFITNEKAEREKLYAQMADDFQIFMDALTTGKAYVPSNEREPVLTVGGKRASGGYANYGRYLLGEQGSEFVLSAGATKAAEGAIRGRLTQEKIISSLGGNSVNLSLALNAGGDIQGAANQAAALVRSEVVNALTRLAQSNRLSGQAM